MMWDRYARDKIWDRAPELEKGDAVALELAQGGRGKRMAFAIELSHTAEVDAARCCACHYRRASRQLSPISALFRCRRL